METQAFVASIRRPRFRRASQSPAFRLTDDDAVIVRLLARHRFLRSTHIAALVGRSLDRTNDRLSRLFHAGYLDRPRAQLDYYPTAGSAPMVYALGDRGARLLIDRDGVDVGNVERSRNNHRAGRPFIEHRLEVVDFYMALRQATIIHGDIRLLHPDELIAAFPDQSFSEGNPFALRANLSHRGTMMPIAVVPDLVFGLQFADGSRRHFLVEIDRGTMPVERSDIRQSSFERKMRAYLAVHTARLHQRHFGWETFRVLTVTTDQYRVESMRQVLRYIRPARGIGASLFYFTPRAELCGGYPLTHAWQDGHGRDVRLI